MNDITVKIVESPKSLVGEGSPSLEIQQPEVDPLAIEDNAEVAVKEPVALDVEEPCDDNAKDESASGNQNDDAVADKLVAQIEKAKEDLLKEETNSVNIQEEVIDPIDPIEEPETPENLDIPEQQTTNDTPPETTQEPEVTPPLVEEVETATSEEVTEASEPLKEPVDRPVPEEIKVKSPEQLKEKSPEKEVKEVPCLPEPKSKPEDKAADVEMLEVAAPTSLEKKIEKIVVAPQSVEKKIEKIEKVSTPPVVEKIEIKEKIEPRASKQAVNGDIAKEEPSTKRRASEDIETESPLKRLCMEVEKTFPQHDVMVNDYIQTATKNNIDEIQRHTEQLLAEIQTLRELAQKKEHEWNNILHLKKVKEEILLRLLRRKQVLSFEKSAEMNGSDRPDPFDYLNQAKNLAIDKSDEISGLAIKQPGSTLSPMIQPPMMPVTSHFNPMSGLPPPYDKAAHMQPMPKPVFPQPLMMPGPMPGFPRDMNGQLTNFGMPMGRQGPIKDVKSIIADYRQRNPEVTPRRGRRMKSILNPNMMNPPRQIAPKVDAMNNLTNLNMLFNNLDMNQKAMLERLQQIQAGGLPNSIFKDALVQFANMQQASAGLIPNRPPETMNRPEHHVKERRRPMNKPERTSVEEPPRPPERPERSERNERSERGERTERGSPRLPPPPPYPEISLLPVSTPQDTQAHQNSLLHGILTKNCGEITITPVQPTPPPAEPPAEKTEEVVQLDDEESPASEGEAASSPAGSGRLVIDEGGDAPDGEGGDTPLCQGCRRRDAQFVCAGCANQWYCSRDCQVAAWDEHSEMCSG